MPIRLALVSKPSLDFYEWGCYVKGWVTVECLPVCFLLPSILERTGKLSAGCGFLSKVPMCHPERQAFVLTQLHLTHNDTGNKCQILLLGICGIHFAFVNKDLMFCPAFDIPLLIIECSSLKV